MFVILTVDFAINCFHWKTLKLDQPRTSDPDSLLADLKQLDRSVQSASTNRSKCPLFSRQDGLSDVAGIFENLRFRSGSYEVQYICFHPNTYSKFSPTNQELCICTDSFVFYFIFFALVNPATIQGFLFLFFIIVIIYN